MTRTKGSKNLPKETLSPDLSKLTAIVADPSQDAETRQDAAKALQDALTPPAPEPAPTPVSDDPFAGCDVWPGDGHKNCVYDSTGNYRGGGGTHDVPCLIDPMHKHPFPFQAARALAQESARLATPSEEAELTRLLDELEKGV